MASVAPSQAWLANARFDLAAFFAPALLATLAFVTTVVLHVSPLLWLWLWLIAFDGPHMLAAYTRAYGDALSWRTRRGLLLGSFAAFAVGPALLWLSAVLAAPALFTAFLTLMSVYSFHHVVRQHWGFTSLYAARAERKPSKADRHWLYAVCWAPYVAFIFTHPSLRQLAGTPESLAQLGIWAAFGLAALWLVGIVRLVLRIVRDLREPRPLQEPSYVLLVALFHGLLFFLVARFEPVYPGALGLDQELMLLGLMSGMFHSGQYIALVGLYHQRSVRSADAPATWFAGRPWRAVAVLLPFAFLYLGVACATGVYPGCQLWLEQRLAPGLGVNQLALGLFWGFALQHYWLDERIWHVRSDARLRHVFGL